MRVAVDVWHIVVIAVALWLAVLVLSVAWSRFRRPVQDSDVHPALYVSYALALATIAGFRISGFGEGADLRLAIETVVLAIGMVGVAWRIRLNNPFKSHRHR